MPGMTAWYGSTKSAEPKAGETGVSTRRPALWARSWSAGQTQGLHCHCVAGVDKCDYVTGELGFDACIDYKAHPEPKDFYAALKAVTPKGIDGHFENVGGSIMDAVMLRMNAFWPHCDVRHDLRLQRRADSDGSAAAHPAVTPQGAGLYRERAHGALAGGAHRAGGTLVATGKLKYRETVAEGLASARRHFRPAQRQNFGKQLVKLA